MALDKLSLDKEPQNINDYFHLDKMIEVEKIKKEIKSKKNIKVAILASFTMNGIKEVLNVKCYQLGIMADIFIAPYNQYVQEILDKNSQLYKFNADIIIIFIDIKSFLGEFFYSPYSLSKTERKDFIENRFGELVTLIGALDKNTTAKIVLHNFEVPLYSVMGILENKMEFGFFESVHYLNNRLKDKFKDNSKVFIFDYEAFCSKYGKKNICEPKMYYLADLKLHFPYIMPLCENYLSYIKPLVNMFKKCLVLDLDNTLWGGILGEDGLEGIFLGPEKNGKPFLELQKYILSLHQRGIILAINSRNNLNDVLEVFKQHPYMILKEEHFASFKINWENKVSNMIEIAKEVNIGLDSITYLDDDFRNRELIKNCLPEVKVVNLPEDYSLYLQTLMELDDFNMFQITDEDKKRGKLYVAQRKRHELFSACPNINEFLKKLNMVITVSGPDSFNIPRIAQLTQRTNQFNMTTKRFQESELKKICDLNDHIIYAITVEDIFGDSGIAGAVIIRKKPKDTWIIDLFLLSCRVLGRQIEKAVLTFIINKSVENKINTLLGIYVPTDKNIPAKEFYKNNGFIKIYNNSQEQVWKMAVKKSHFKDIDFIKIIEKA